MALPSFLVPLWEPVTVRCQGPPGVDSYRLERLRPTEYKDQATLVIPAMKAEFAGRYRCFYQMGAGWSPASEQLELVATGAFDKPSLSARPSTEVSPGGRVTLQCRATYGFDRFALYKEGDPRTSQRPGKWYEADFSLGAVTPAVGGTYRCYSFSSKSPYLWSAPSDPLELAVTGFPEASGKVTASPLGAVSALASSPAGELLHERGHAVWPSQTPPSCCPHRGSPPRAYASLRPAPTRLSAPRLRVSPPLASPPARIPRSPPSRKRFLSLNRVTRPAQSLAERRGCTVHFSPTFKVGEPTRPSTRPSGRSPGCPDSAPTQACRVLPVSVEACFGHADRAPGQLTRPAGPLHGRCSPSADPSPSPPGDAHALRLILCRVPALGPGLLQAPHHRVSSTTRGSSAASSPPGTSLSPQGRHTLPSFLPASTIPRAIWSGYVLAL